jgi:hypothetical protein
LHRCYRMRKWMGAAFVYGTWVCQRCGMPVISVVSNGKEA